MRPDTEALLIIDVQNDFCPGGALAVPDGDDVVDPINELLREFQVCVLTQDWHPEGHSSFASQHPGAAPFTTTEMSYGAQVLWPDHCIVGSAGAAFHSRLDANRAQAIVRKGFRREIDSYSGFFENDHQTPTGLEGYLRSRGVDSVVIAGLATDFCVNFTALDAARLGFATTVLEGASRGIDLEGSLGQAREAMTEAGVSLVG